MMFSQLPQHHAILCVDTNREQRSTLLYEELFKMSLAHRLFDQTVLDIGTAREIISWANTPYNEEKIAVISFHTIGIPAQNAMLKILEEPRPGVRFILVTSNKEALLPTVLSRLHVMTTSLDKGTQAPVALFLKTSPTARMKLPYIVELLEKEDEEGRKDREGARAFLLELAETLAQQHRTPSRYTQKVFEMASYASDPSASIKAILEYVSLLLPCVK